MRLIVPCLLSLGLLGCEQRGEQPPPELIVEVPAVALDGSMAGWDLLPIGAPVVRTYDWGRVPQFQGGSVYVRGWQPTDEAIPWSDGIAMLVAEDGSEFPLHPEGVAPQPEVLAPDGTMSPGSYDLVVDVDGFDPILVEGITYGAHGQIPEFDSGVIDGGIHSPRFTTATLNMTDFVPVHLRLSPVDAGIAELTVWAQGFNDDHAALCRAWQGEVEVGPTGLVTASRDEIVAGGATPITFRDLTLNAGLNADGSEIAGLELDVVVDTRALDSLVEPEGTGGETCDLLERLGSDCFACDETEEAHCAELAVRGGFGERRTADALLGDLEIDLDSIDDAPLCGGPDDGGDLPILVCSAIGPVGVGAWFIGLGAVFMRRRRSTAA